MTKALVVIDMQKFMFRGDAPVFQSKAHSTFDTEDLREDHLIAHHNKVLRWFAHTKETEDISFEVIR
ncbi:hypothetical protein [Pontibacillus sp. HMF3514]|uniref:hypothetical protein n=1 Tax=Pontibacillus sp. HMF3514 TaxID=2692425 RepID=UPI00131FB5F6|nr:hypothetical protein [Pontibacillus sp. HMF3514]QHE51286.1 hypothetical protein GS400_04235 [Pontibacillus sp. HMF3514]